MYTFIEIPSFSRSVADYLDDDELSDLQRHLIKMPDVGDVVPGTGGVRKLRWNRAGMGKRGGVRVLYYIQDRHGRIWLLAIYAKSARENIATTTLNRLRELADPAKID